MTPTEVVMLARIVKAICPAQQMDEFTPDAWTHLLDDVRLADAQEAVRNLGKRQRFIAPSEIRDEVRRIRAERLESFDLDVTPPAELADDPTAYIAWLREAIRRAADGEPLRQPELPTRDMSAIEGVFRKVPER